MTPAAFNAFCRSLPHSTFVEQWSGGQVWKVGGKMFAVCWPGESHVDGITFKASPLSYDMLKTQAGLRPAPYMASRGMKWLQWYSAETLDEAALRDYLRASYDLVAAGLSKKLRMELGLENAKAEKRRLRKTS
jgi:predicted DNA-binding protein (MmcQ/YjbR family)